MKKTKSTALTAAVLAAAMSSSACGNIPQAGEQEKETVARPLSNQLIAEEAERPTYPSTTFAPLYGPPWVLDPDYNDGEITTEDPNLNEEDPYDPSEIIPEPTYGPMPATYPGDIDWDSRLDANDLTLMRMEYLDGYEPYLSFERERYDVNRDGVFDINDINALSRYLKGDISSFDEVIGVEPVTEEETTAPPEPDTQPPTTTYFAPLYGPPSVFGY